MIAPQPFFEPRGTPISVYSRLRMLSSLDYQVDLLTYHVGSDVDIPNVRIHRIFSLPFVRRVKVGPSWIKFVLDILLLIKAVRMLASTRYDVLHSHEEAAFFCIWLARIFGVRHVYDMHSSLPRQLEKFRFGDWWPIVNLFERLERKVILSADAVITIDEDLEAHVKTINPRVHCINIVNLAVQDLLNLQEPDLVQKHKARLWLEGRFPIVYTGTLERYQGIGLLIDSMRIVRQSHAEALLIIVGGTPEQVAYWQDYVNALRLNDVVVFTGRVTLDESLDFIDLAEILVSPRTDGTATPLKIYSYVRSGKPIVATNVRAHAQILHDEVAVIVEPTGEAFAEGLVRVIESPELRASLSQQVQSLASDMYALEGQAAKLHSAYQLMNGRLQTTPNG